MMWQFHSEPLLAEQTWEGYYSRSFSKPIVNLMIACIPLTFLGFLRVSGPQARTLLQGQLTCQMDDLTPDVSRLGAQCNPQGRIISFFRLFFWMDAFYLQMPLNLIPIAEAALKKYAVFYKVEITDVSADMQSLALTGFKAEALLASLGLPAPTITNAVMTTDSLSITKLPCDEPLYEILGETTSIQNFQNKLSAQTQLQNESAWHLLQMRTGIPMIYAETSQQFLPHELNLPLIEAVSFNKGCYTGQEIIARMHYRGIAKKSVGLGKATASTPPTRGADIYTLGNAIGTLVDYTEIEPQHYVVSILLDQREPITTPIYLDQMETQPLHLSDPLPTGLKHV